MIGPEVTLVIPGRNAAGTVEACLESVVPLLAQGLVREILFVDDGSTDETAAIVDAFPVRMMKGHGRGAGAARNIGWRAATSPLVWFIDSDCVAEPHALELLVERLGAGSYDGVGGSYANMRPDSLLACLIQEEITERHRRMPEEVDFLATFNVLYRRETLEKVGGFDERFLKAQDAELAYRIRRAGGRLGFVPESRVGHFHPHRLMPYLQTQARQGYWRAWLYVEYPNRMGGDSYSGLTDHAQPLLAVWSLILLPFLWWAPAIALQGLTLLALAAAQLPMMNRIVSRKRSLRYVSFGAMSFLRAYARGIGLALGALHAVAQRYAVGSRGIESCRRP